MMKATPRSLAPTATLFVAVGVLVGFVGSTVVEGLRHGAAVPPEPVALEPILTRLDAIEQFMRNHSPTVVGDPPTEGVRQDLGWRQEILDRIRAMEEHLSTVAQGPGVANGAALWQVRRANPDQKLAHVDKFERNLRKDKPGTLREILAIPFVGALERFGTPIRIDTVGEHEAIWIYAPRMGDDGRYVYLRFLDGLVVDAYL